MFFGRETPVIHVVREAVVSVEARGGRVGEGAVGVQGQRVASRWPGDEHRPQRRRRTIVIRIVAEDTFKSAATGSRNGERRALIHAVAVDRRRRGERRVRHRRVVDGRDGVTIGRLGRAAHGPAGKRRGRVILEPDAVRELLGIDQRVMDYASRIDYAGRNAHWCSVRRCSQRHRGWCNRAVCQHAIAIDPVL